MRSTALVCLLTLLVFLPACRAEKTPLPPDLQTWRQEREASLRSETGWLTLIGLHWLAPGENRFGSDGGNAVIIDVPGVPKDAGSLFLEDGKVRLVSRAGKDLTVGGRALQAAPLKTDLDGKPDLVQVGRVSFFIIQRGNRFGVRVKDPQAETRLRFPGLEYFPYDPAWKVEARFVPFAQPRQVTIPTAIGTTDNVNVPGELHFQLKGKEHKLLPFSDDGGKTGFFIVFRDTTSGQETYGAGRFLDTEPLAQGKVILDFNRAYNPPCAFTPYATCPLPPRQNHLPLAVTAGEKKPADH